MNNFINVAKNNVTDVRTFLAKAAGGNSIKYSPVGGETHHIYIPSREVAVIDPNSGNQVMQRQLIALEGPIHEWKDADGKFRKCICLKGQPITDENGALISDGTCPFCDRVSDAWEIYNYRFEEETAKTNLKGEELTKHLDTVKKGLLDQLKAKKPTPYMYVLVVKFKMNDKNATQVAMGADNLPEFELKVMKLSSQRLEKINGQLQMSGLDFAGAEIGFKYPEFSGPDAAKFIVGQSTITPLFGPANFTSTYPGLKDKIDLETSKFVWDDLENAFPEWKGMTTNDAKLLMTSSFEKWDEYKKIKIANPKAKYLEYVAETPETPEIQIPQATVPPTGIPVAGIPTTEVPMPNMAAANANMGTPNVDASAAVYNVNQQQNVQMPGVGVQQTVVQPTQTASPDPNSLFNGVSVPTI